jgi:hypothetical protein
VVDLFDLPPAFRAHPRMAPFYAQREKRKPGKILDVTSRPTRRGYSTEETPTMTKPTRRVIGAA